MFKFFFLVTVISIPLMASEKATEPKPNRMMASVMARAPIQSMVELCTELSVVRDLPLRVKNFCTAERAKAKVASEQAEKEQDFKRKVKALIIASASKTSPQIPVAKLKWETLECSEAYEKVGYFCTVQSTESTPWRGGDNGEGAEFNAPNGVRVEVDKNGRLKPGDYSISYGCLLCAG